METVRRTVAAALASVVLLVPWAPPAAGAAPPQARPLSSACPDGAVPPSDFRDLTPGGVHTPAIECVSWWGLTSGRTILRYSPGTAVTRGQMATFIGNLLVRGGADLPDDPPDSGFTDVAGTTHAARIAQLAAVGVVRGYGDGTYRPGRSVSRAEMAAFVIRALAVIDTALVPADAPDAFVDDDGLTLEPEIDALAALRIVVGVGDDRYLPHEPVRRDQMASFLARSLALLVDEGHAQVPSELATEIVAEVVGIEQREAARAIGGSFVNDLVGSAGDSAFDAPSRELRELLGGDDVLPFLGRVRNLPLGGPDLRPHSQWPGDALQPQLSRFVAALAATDDGRVEAIMYRDRPAWRFRGRIVPPGNEPDGPDQVEAVVDAETGAPHFVELRRGGTLRSRTIITVFRELGYPQPQRDYLPEWEFGESATDDARFAETDLDGVAALVGYEPYVPADVPEGYDLDRVLVRPGPNNPDSARPEPPGTDVVALTYRNGWFAFTVTTRLAEPEGVSWTDPYRWTGFERYPTQPATVESGALAGALGAIAFTPEAEPYLWAATDDVLVTVDGALTSAQLQQVAGSLAKR